jgi:hypothetical protein
MSTTKLVIMALWHIVWAIRSMANGNREVILETDQAINILKQLDELINNVKNGGD